MTAVCSAYFPAGQPSAAFQRQGPDLFPQRRAGAPPGLAPKVAQRSRTVDASSVFLAAPRFLRARLRAIHPLFPLTPSHFCGRAVSRRLVWARLFNHGWRLRQRLRAGGDRDHSRRARR